MTFALTWMPRALEEAGLKVATVPGWETRGRAEMGKVMGVICHHTAGPASGNMPSLRTLVEGRPDLSGPLSQLGLGRDGTWYVIAAGRCNHAGAGSWQGLVNGNTNFIGVEAENTGLPADAWPEFQMASYRLGVATLLMHIGQPVEFCAGHKEYAPQRKDDPSFDMSVFRRDVAAIIEGQVPPKALIPVAEPVPQTGNAAPRPTLRRGAFGDLVKSIQRKCGVADDGVFGAKTEAALREFQRSRGLVPDGIVGPVTWKALDEA